MDGTAQDPALEARVGRLEVDMHDVKSTLGRLEPLIVSIHSQMPYLATKAELERVRGDIEAKVEGFRGSLEAKIEGVRGSLEAKIESVRGSLEAKIESVRGELQGVRGDLEAKIEGVRGEVQGFRGDLRADTEGLRGEVRAGLAGKPGYGAMWSMGITLVVVAVAAGAAYLPLLARMVQAMP